MTSRQTLKNMQKIFALKLMFFFDRSAGQRLDLGNLLMAAIGIHKLKRCQHKRRTALKKPLLA